MLSSAIFYVINKKKSKLVESMLNIAVTGATGFIGRNFLEYAQKNFETKIHAIVRKTADINSFKNQNVNPVFYDGTFDSLNEFFSKNKVDVVIHLATLYIFDHKPQDIDALIDSNIKFGCHLLEAATSNNCRNFINTGSYIQNYFSEKYYPSCLYAATKQSMENIIDHYAVNRNLNAITLKLYDVYGPDDTRKKIINLFKESQKDGGQLKMSPGEQELRLTYIEDVLDAFVIATKMLLQTSQKRHETYYVGAKAYKLKEVAKIFEEVTKKSLNIEWGAFPYRENQPLESYIGKLLPNWQIKVDLKDGIQNMLNSSSD
jgi:nucleoside-diphosphate-sugar epimerase